MPNSIDLPSQIQKIQRELHSMNSISERLDYLLEVSLSLFGATTGSISIINPEEEVLTIVAAKGMDWQKKIAAKIPFSMGITGKAAASGIMQYVPDVKKEPKYIALIDSVVTELAIPLVTRKETIGILNLESDKKNYFSNDVINNAVLFANQLTIILLEERIATEAMIVAKQEEDPVEKLLGYDPQILFIKNRIRQLGPTDLSVLLIGEIGVGKSSTAKILHEISNRNSKPFQQMDCNGVSEEQLDQLLFGDSGIISKASGGTIFLNSIASMPLEMQKKLVKILSNREIQEVRLLVGSLTDLSEELHNNRFEESLFFLISEATIRIPPLRERRGDIPLLTQHFIFQFTKQYGREVSFSRSLTLEFGQKKWPGNVRELVNKIRFGFLTSEDGEAKNLLENPSNWEPQVRPIVPGDDLNLSNATEKLEAAWIKEALKRGGTQEIASKLLGISRGALQYKLKNNPLLTEKTE